MPEIIAAKLLHQFTLGIIAVIKRICVIVTTAFPSFTFLNHPHCMSHALYSNTWLKLFANCIGINVKILQRKKKHH